MPTDLTIDDTETHSVMRSTNCQIEQDDVKIFTLAASVAESVM